MLVVMRSMFKDRRLNAGLIAGSFVAIVLLTWLIRTQTPVGSDEFLRSMIPHHSSAILMCQEATITDPEIAGLCRQIVESQEEEIAQMVTLLKR